MAISKEEREKYLKVKAWNEYVIEHLGLRCEKRTSQIYSITVYQGTFSIYHNWTSRREERVPIEMHSDLHGFLTEYMEHFFKLNGIGVNPIFKPAEILK